MSYDICDDCAENNGKIYKCSKCGAQLCRHTIRPHVCSPTNLGLRSVRSSRLKRGDISEQGWQRFIRKNK